MVPFVASMLYIFESHVPGSANPETGQFKSNNFTGSMPDGMCDLANLTVLVADCPAHVECECCSECADGRPYLSPGTTPSAPSISPIIAPTLPAPVEAPTLPAPNEARPCQFPLKHPRNREEKMALCLSPNKLKLVAAGDALRSRL